MTRRLSLAIILNIGRYLLLTVWSFLFFIPLAWVVSTSLKQTGLEFEYPPRWIPDPIVLGNYLEVFRAVPYARFIVNSLIVVVAAGLGAVLTSSLVAYGFSRFRFPGRDFWFLVVLATMMLPDAVTLIPQYVIFTRLDWIDTLLPLTVLPWFGGGAFNIFLFRQFLSAIPIELDEAARMDGASVLRIYAQLLMPLSRPVIATVAILGFIYNWNDFMRPLIFLNTAQHLTMAVGINLFRFQYGGYWNLLMAASFLMTIPMMLVFFLGQRYFVEGALITGLAGR
ncbi:MAG: carbohydrate ABC transporter permease [Anaerolineae bacterium]